MQMTLSRSQLTLDSAGFVTADGRPLNLPPKERAVLALLLARQPHVVSKSEFAAAAWGRQLMSDESLARSISRLRRALSPFGLLISSVYGSGYRLSGDEPPPFQTNPPGACRSAQQRAQQRTLAGLGRAMAPLRRQLEQEPGVATARVLAAEGRAAGGCGWVGAAPHRATNDPKFGSCPPTLAGFFNADESLRLFGTLTPWVKPTI
ncbi:MAG: transcriptional regulator [Betaproteobacteria bacterium]|jgi:two-component system OmpR family response regulator|nr:winged helix-turn-helix domain-containing protein [Rubrivivax sp.]